LATRWLGSGPHRGNVEEPVDRETGSARDGKLQELFYGSPSSHRRVGCRLVEVIDALDLDGARVGDVPA